MTRDATHILGIHDGHNCGATLVRDGRVVASVSEERLTGRKNEVGYPSRAVAEVLRIGGIEASELSEATFASLFMHAPGHLTDVEPWYVVGIEEQRADFARSNEYQKIVFESRKAERIAAVREQLGLAAGNISFVEHHLAHLAGAYYTAPFSAPDKPVLGLTCDGAGDGIAGSVTICRGNDFERLAAIDRHASLGKIYSRATLMLGMKPWEHEYKLMGLAPYAGRERCERAADSLRKLIRVDAENLTFVRCGELSTNYCYHYLRDAFERVRFDVISGAVQLFTEEMLLAWVKAAIARTGIRDIVCGGGVFMNVKANMLLAQLPEVNSIYVMPSAADESLSIGAALYRAYQRSRSMDRSASALPHLYLGGDTSREAERQALAAAKARDDLEITEPADIDAEIARFIADGEIVARCRGPMEWGARALGNRSILASAHDYRVVDRINRIVKQRDFWMPFAPSILAEQAERYVEDPKGLNPPFMTFALPSRPETYEEITAGSHPRDRTVRAQIVSQNANPGYHRLIGRFAALTGRGAVLNTSFNLHGYPIAYTTDDALGVLRNSELDRLALNHHLVRKRGHETRAA